MADFGRNYNNDNKSYGPKWKLCVLSRGHLLCVRVRMCVAADDGAVLWREHGVRVCECVGAHESKSQQCASIMQAERRV